MSHKLSYHVNILYPTLFSLFLPHDFQVRLSYDFFLHNMLPTISPAGMWGPPQDKSRQPFLYNLLPPLSGKVFYVQRPTMHTFAHTTTLYN